MPGTNDSTRDVNQEADDRRREAEEIVTIHKSMQKRTGQGKSSGEVLGLDRLVKGNFSLAIYIIFLVLAVSFAAVFVYASSAASKVEEVFKTYTELETMLEEQAEAASKLDERITAVDAEFRRALAKDREEITAFQKQLTEEMGKKEVLLQKFKEDTQMQVTNYKSQVADNQAVTGKIEREYKEIAAQFGVIQEELKGLRTRIMDVKPEM